MSTYTWISTADMVWVGNSALQRNRTWKLLMQIHVPFKIVSQIRQSNACLPVIVFYYIQNKNNKPLEEQTNLCQFFIRGFFSWLKVQCEIKPQRFSLRMMLNLLVRGLCWFYYRRWIGIRLKIWVDFFLRIVTFHSIFFFQEFFSKCCFTELEQSRICEEHVNSKYQPMNKL